MSRISKILVATDYSDYARRAETRAAMLAFELKARMLEMMTVIGASCGPDPGGSLPASGGDEDRPGPATQTYGMTIVRSMHSGDPAVAVAARAAEMGADLTVVAGRGSDFLADLFVRESIHALVRRIEGPLLLVNREPQSTYRRVVVAIDFTPATGEAVRMALDIAPSACFTFVHAYRTTGENAMHEAGLPESTINAMRERGCAAARAELNALIDGLRKRNTVIARSVEAGHPVRIIGETVKRTDADLIVIGKRNKPEASELLPGSVTQRLLAGRDADLLVVPAAAEEDWLGGPAA